MITNKIRNTLKKITDDLCNLISEIPIKRVQDVPGIVIIAPPIYLDKLSTSQTNTQFKLKRRYDTISELLKLILRDSPKNVAQKLKKADNSYREWIELQPKWSLSSDHNDNIKNINKISEDIEALIDILEVDKDKNTIIIPDTNSLLISSDPKTYKVISESNEFTFILLPTVLSELDKLKILHRNPEVRDKAKKVIARIKGWRNQGSLIEGVTVNKTITVIAEHKEPNINNSLSWLDSENADDRIIASVLSIQAAFSSSRIILATSDINLQNKADSAMIEIGEVK